MTSWLAAGVFNPLKKWCRSNVVNLDHHHKVEWTIFNKRGSNHPAMQGITSPWNQTLSTHSIPCSNGKTHTFDLEDVNNVAIHKVWAIVSKSLHLTPKYPVPLFWLKPKTQAGRDCGPALIVGTGKGPKSTSTQLSQIFWTMRHEISRLKKKLMVYVFTPEEYGYLQIVIMIIAIITGMVMQVKMAWRHFCDHQHHTNINMYIELYREIYTRINTYTHVRYIYMYICVCFFPEAVCSSHWATRPHQRAQNWLTTAISGREEVRKKM